MNRDPLNGPKSKVKRAKRHIADLERLVHEWANGENTRVLVEEFDEESGQKTFKLVAGDTPDEEIDVIAGDVLSNLNSALDQLACALALLNGATSVKDVYFPVGESIGIFEDRRFATTIKKLPEAAIKLIKRLKPYKGGCGLLYGTHELGRIDRHRMIVPLGMLNPVGSFYVHRIAASSIRLERPWWQSLEDGIKLLTVDVGSEGDLNYQIAFDVGFRKSEIFEGEPIATVLNQSVNLIERIITIFDRKFFMEGATHGSSSKDQGGR